MAGIRPSCIELWPNAHKCRIFNGYGVFENSLDFMMANKRKWKSIMNPLLGWKNRMTCAGLTTVKIPWNTWHGYLSWCCSHIFSLVYWPTGEICALWITFTVQFFNFLLRKKKHNHRHHHRQTRLQATTFPFGCTQNKALSFEMALVERNLIKNFIFNWCQMYKFKNFHFDGTPSRQF